MNSPIEDYGLIGNSHTAALVGRDGSIDWLCLPRFDGEAVFAALLGGPENGRWLIAPVEPGKNTRSYRGETGILETRMETKTGCVTVIDFMPLPEPDGQIDLIRLVRGDAGQVRMKTELILRFDYGRSIPWVRFDGPIKGTGHTVSRQTQQLIARQIPVRVVDERIQQLELPAGQAHLVARR